MPIQQIAVVPLRETAINGKSARRSKEKSEGAKTPGKSGIRSSNISKASNSSALGAASRTAVTPSPQDICSSGQLTRLDGNASAINKPTSKHTGPGVAADGSSTLGSSSQAKKKPLKRRHRRQRDSCGAVHCVDTGAKGDRTALAERSPSTDRSEREENRAERPPKARRERALPPRLRKLTARESDTTSEEEGGRREARSWSKEKARRGRRRSGSSRERDGVTEVRAGGDNGETMELQSVGSDEGEKKNPAWMESEVGPKRRRSVGGSLTTNGGGGSQREGSQGNEKKLGGYKSLSHGGSSLAEEGEELITKLYQEKGSGVGDMSVSTPREHCCVNGGTVQLCSDDSEMEVCRICHCGREEECPLITPCWCTGSLGFVHQACLNQWILSSDTRCCELCKYDFIMETQLKPIRKWEKLNMSKGERRKIFCSVLFHLFAIACVLWSVCVLVKRTVEEVRLGRNDELWRITLVKYYTAEGVVEWPFWTKLIVVAVGLMGGLIFMYIQCNVYLQLWRRLKAFNRIITVQNCPEKGLSSSRAVPSTLANGKLQAVDPSPVPIPEADSDLSVEAAVAPAKNPV